MKQRSLELLQKGWELSHIAEALDVLPQSVSRWVDNYQQHGHVNPALVLGGRCHLLTGDVLQELRELVFETPTLFIDEIAEGLAIYHDQPISTTALHDNLRDLGFTYKLLRGAAAERDNVARAQWLYDITSHFTADQLVFADESSKDGRTVFRRYGRAPAGVCIANDATGSRGLL